MARCDQCETLVLFGGKREQGKRFCSALCLEQGIRLIQGAERIEVHVSSALAARHEGHCPLCAGPGPVDVHRSHLVYSIVLYTAWRSIARVCCRDCGWRFQMGALLRCLALGWWGMPLGLLLTPIQIGRNLHGLLWPPDPSRPSSALERQVRQQLIEASLHPETAGGGSSRKALRMEREGKAKRGELPAEERLSVLLEHLLEFEQMAAQRCGALHFDAPSGYAAALTLATPAAAWLGAGIAAEPLSHWIITAGRISILLGLGLLGYSLATDCTRFVRRRLSGPIREALSPFQPSALEIEQLISSMRAGDWVLGRRLRSEWLKGE